ncbi:unnamed protein product [Symbiodinium natans]|uniref:EF-hand domain-containing protein n=1 Tax=Symbiodinium natans TaxID=878477 RepID=A0A812PMZ3_9DINO|nr:unnamed protein product [Symbiodinium natans]
MHVLEMLDIAAVAYHAFGPLLPGKAEDDAHCADCFTMAMCQHPYCGTCGFCVSASFSRDRELLDYQCMCEKCARAMNRCCACGKAFNGKPTDVSLPMNHGGSDDEGPGELLGLPGDSEDNWEERMAAAIAIAEKYSGFSKFHHSYPPLFAKLWDKYDPDHLGEISAEQAKSFAEDMVAAGWKDWKPSAQDLALWQRIMDESGGISLEQFAEASENDNFAALAFGD